VADQRFSPVSSTNKMDHNDITEILLKVALNTITLASNPNQDMYVLQVVKSEKGANLNTVL
jgi:hypothetical protein